MERAEAIERIKARFDKWALDNEDTKAIQALIPELKESEDERIRMALIKTFEKKLEIGFEWTEFGIPNRSVLDWLEKQKEQKPTEWSEEDETAFKCIKAILTDYISESYKGSKYCTNEQVKEWIKWFDTVFHSLRSQPRWKPNEEQMKALGDCVLGRTPDADARVTLEILWDNLQKLL